MCASLREVRKLILDKDPETMTVLESIKMLETRKLSLSLISLLQESRRKGMDLAESLERFSLSI